MLFLPLQKAGDTILVEPPVDLLTVTGHRFSAYYAQEWLLFETHSGQRGAGTVRCSEPQP